MIVAGKELTLYIGIEAECSEEFKIAGPACHVKKWGASWSLESDWTIRLMIRIDDHIGVDITWRSEASHGH